MAEEAGAVGVAPVEQRRLADEHALVQRRVELVEVALAAAAAVRVGREVPRRLVVGRSLLAREAPVLKLCPGSLLEARRFGVPADARALARVRAAVDAGVVAQREGPRLRVRVVEEGGAVGDRPAAPVALPHEARRRRAQHRRLAAAVAGEQLPARVGGVAVEHDGELVGREREVEHVRQPRHLRRDLRLPEGDAVARSRRHARPAPQQPALSHEHE